MRRLSKKDATLDKLMFDIEEARADVKAGRVYNIEEVEIALGI